MSSTGKGESNAGSDKLRQENEKQPVSSAANEESREERKYEPFTRETSLPQ